MALDDADEETGCVEYASGSHKWRPLLNGKNQEDNNDIPEKAIDTMSAFHASDEVTYRGGMDRAAKLAAVTNPYDTIESAPTKEGHAILHHQDIIWHGSGPNRSSANHRRALVAHYIRGDITFQTCSESANGPFGNATYIYGRYKQYSQVDLNESFFPIIYGHARTEWIDNFARLL